MLTLRLPPEIENRLEALAKATGRTKSFYAIQAIIMHIDELEDANLATDVLERIKRGDERTLTGKEIWDDMDD